MKQKNTIVKILRIRKYQFFQNEKSDVGHIDVFQENRKLQSLGIYFDPTAERKDFWGYPLPSSGMTIKEWTQHCQKAKQAIEKIGGIEAFERLAEKKIFKIKSLKRS